MASAAQGRTDPARLMIAAAARSRGTHRPVAGSPSRMPARSSRLASCQVVTVGMAGRAAQRCSVTISYRCVLTMLGNVDRPGRGGMTVALPASHARPQIVARSGRRPGRFVEGRPRSMGPKIAIVGGGIGGLTAAVALARRGLAAEVYEQAPVLEEAGAGVGLWPNAMTALEPIGLSGKVARLAVNVGRQGLRRSDGTWLMSFPGDLMTQRWGAGFVLVHRPSRSSCRLLSPTLRPYTSAPAAPAWRTATGP